MKFKHKRLISLLIVLLLIPLGCEAVFSLDPWGMYYFRDMAKMREAVLPSEAGFTYAPGTYQLTHSNFTMLDDSTRRVPATNEDAPHTLVLLGDSVTFAWGVNDEDTWANLLAEEYPNWHVINTGIPAYNSENVRLAHELYPDADAYVYLIVDNDADKTRQYNFDQEFKYTPPSWTSMYFEYMTFNVAPAPPPPEWERFKGDLEALQSDPRVLIAAFPNAVSDFAKTFLPSLHVVPEFTGRNSYVDPHASVLGNQQIWDELKPLVDEHLRTLAAPSDENQDTAQDADT